MDARFIMGSYYYISNVITLLVLVFKMKYNFNHYIVIVLILFGIFFAWKDDMIKFLYGWVGALIIMNWEIMRILSEKFEK